MTIGARLDRSARPVFVVGPGVDRNGAWDAGRGAGRAASGAGVGQPDVVALQLSRAPSAVRGLPAADARADRQAASTATTSIVALGAPVFTYHIEGFGPHVPPGAELFQMIDDPDVAAWTPRRHVARLQRPPRRARRCCERPAPPATARPARPAARRRGSSAAIASRSPYLMQTLAETPPGRQHPRRRVAVEPRDDAGAPADRAAAQLLHLRQRRPRPQPAGGGRHRAGDGRRAARDRPVRRRLGDVLDSGAVVGRRPEAADDHRHRQQRRLCGAQRVPRRTSTSKQPIGTEAAAASISSGWRGRSAAPACGSKTRASWRPRCATRSQSPVPILVDVVV